MHVDALAGQDVALTPESAPAVEAKTRALLAAGRGGVLTRVALGRALTAMGRCAEAAEVLREASLLSPNTPEVVLALGEALAAAGALPGAIGEYQRAARLAPGDFRPHWQIALLWLEAGEADRAEASARTALELGADNEAEIAALFVRAQAMRAAARADAGYVRHLFNQFAADYDTRMRERLGYAAPRILRELAQLLVAPDARLDILDLGCGTGLCGAEFRPMARRLSGIDLSPRMLEKACATGIYEHLEVGDVERPPDGFEGPFDAIVAGDVLVYLGDLSAVFAAVRARLAPDGLFFFTTEQATGAAFEMGPKRRYRHSEEYLRGLAREHGMEPASLVSCAVRHEAGEPVASWAAAFRLVKP